MMTYKNCIQLALTFTICISTTFAQVGVGTNDPRGSLDVNDINNFGLVHPRVSNVESVTDGQGNLPVLGTAVYDISRNSYCYLSFNPAVNDNEWICFTIATTIGNPETTVVSGRSITTPSPFFQESFETDGDGTRYTLSYAEDIVGPGNFFSRVNTNPNNVGNNVVLPNAKNGLDGDFYFGARDINATSVGNNNPTMLFNNIDISGMTNLSFKILIAENPDTTENWDQGDSFIVEFQIDGGGFQDLLAIASIGNNNQRPAEDTDFDGVGDGTFLTQDWQDFQRTITGTGSTLDLRLSFIGLRSNTENIGIDNIRVYSN